MFNSLKFTLIYLSLILISTSIYSIDKKKLYLQGYGEGKDSSVNLVIHSSLLEGLMDSGKNVTILDDNSMSSLFKQYSLSIQLASDTDKFYEKIAESPYKPDYIVHYSYKLDNDIYIINARLVELDNDIYRISKSMSIESSKYQLQFFMKELGLYLLQKNYTIQKSNIPQKFVFQQTKIDLTEFQTKDIIIPKFNSNSTNGNLNLTVKEFLILSDELNQKGEFEKSEKLHKEILELLNDYKNKKSISGFIKQINERRKILISKIWEKKILKISTEDLQDNDKVVELNKYHKELFNRFTEISPNLRNKDIEFYIIDLIHTLTTIEIENNTTSIYENISNLNFDKALELSNKNISLFSEMPKFKTYSKRKNISLVALKKERSKLEKTAFIYLKTNFEELLNISESEDTRASIYNKMGETEKAKELKINSVNLIIDAKNMFINNNLLKNKTNLNNLNNAIIKVNDNNIKDTSLVNFFMFGVTPKNCKDFS